VPQGTSYTSSQFFKANSKEWVPWQLMAQQVSTADFTTLHNPASGNTATSAEIATTGSTGFDIAEDGSGGTYLWRIPQDCSLDGSLFDIKIYPVCYINGGVSGDASSWTVAYKPLSGTTDAFGLPATTDGVTGGTLTWVAASAATRAQTGISLDVSTMISDGGLAETDEFLYFLLTCDDIDNGGAGFAANEQILLGFWIEYNIPV